MTRRKVLKGILALSAYIAIPASLKTELSSKELFQKGINKGVVEYMTFNFDYPIRLSGIDDLIIRNCIFNFNFKGGDAMITIEDCNNMIMENCSFQNKHLSNVGIAING